MVIFHPYGFAGLGDIDAGIRPVIHGVCVYLTGQFPRYGPQSEMPLKCLVGFQVAEV